MVGEGSSAVGRVALVWDDRVVSYDLGGGHPLAPVRVELTVELIRRSGLLSDVAVEVLPGTYDEVDLLRVHRADFIDTVRRLSADPRAVADAMYGLGEGDTPAFAGMHEASLLISAASREAARLVWEGEADHAFNPSGGLHHAMPDRAAGFCVYNDVAVAIDWLLEQGAERVCYVDVDVHHGDGVEVMFADDPRVLTISLHESGQYLFPGTGRVTDIGEDGARGSIVNVPLLPGTTGEIWMPAFDQIVDPLVRAFSPDILITQLGCDSHTTDPLAHLALTLDDMAAIYRRLHGLAHEAADGKWVAMGGGGYQIVDVVPPAWTIAFAEMSSRTLPVDIPMDWRELAHGRTGLTPPRSFTEDPARVGDGLKKQASVAARDVIDALRTLVLPLHGAQ